MLIKVKNDQVISDSKDKIELDNLKKLHVFQNSNNFQEIDLKNLNFSDDLTNIIYNESFLIEDRKLNKLSFYRDWPGNIQTFFYFNKAEKYLFISDSISSISSVYNGIRLSKKGTRLFLSQRKHFHSYTIYDNIHVLHPGLKITLDLISYEFEIESWYTPFKKISISKFQIGKLNYLNGIDECIKRLIPYDKNIALMFSGGSDSCFLLWRLKELGYKHFDLFTICIKGENITNHYASENAKLFGAKVNLIQFDQENAFQKWREVLTFVYNYLSDMRINGMFAPSYDVYNYLKEYYNNEECRIIWGSQYSLISPVLTSNAIFFKIIPAFIFSFFIKLKFFKTFFENLSIKILRSHMLKKELMHSKSRKAFENLYKSAIIKISNFDQLINIFLSTDYNHLKHWWMDWRNKMSNKYYKKSINVYPFHDRKFQEDIMRFSFSLRIGGKLNLFSMPNSYKSFFYNLFPNEIKVKQLKKGNVKALSEWQSLYKNLKFYNSLKEEIEYLNKEISIDIFCDNNITFPNCFEDFEKLSSKDIEKLSGVLFILQKIKIDKIKTTFN